jgi:hypothetical protein
MNVDFQTGEVLPPLGPLAAALAKAQMAFPVVTRSKTVRVTTKTGGSYTFSYAPLDVILDAVRKPLADNGLAVVQLLDREALVTMLLHESGAFLEARTPIPATADVQNFGSAITYLRRYALQALLGIAAEEDDDGNSASGNQVAPQKPATARQTASGPRASNGTAPAAATVTQTVTTGDLDESDWADLIEETAPAKPTAISSEPGLNSRDFFTRTDNAGIARAHVTNKAKQLFGANNWKVTELSDEQRAQLWFELEPVKA